MSTALSAPEMSRAAFLEWAERQEAPYEFDGVRPVPMNGSTVGHDTICQNLWFLLRTGLRGAPFISGGPNLGLATPGGAVRYPDAYVAAVRPEATSRLVEDVVVVFEVLSPGSGRVDRVDKVREYAAVPSILRYVLIEQMEPGVTSYHRVAGAAGWSVAVTGPDEILALPEIGTEVPVAMLYEGLALTK